MLSTENPPPDLCEISQLNSVSSDERDSGSNQQQFEVDLFNSGLDDSNPLPKFSIRDYVFNTRGKDIKNNWPFSQKNLQLCLKHGVKDVLPPFQSLDSVRNPSSVECAVENLRYSDIKHSELSDHSVHEKLAVDIENTNSTEFEEDKEFPSTTTSQSCADINSVPSNKSLCLEPEAEHLPVSVTEKPEFAVQLSNQVESNIQSPVKKCRLIVKLNNIAEPKSNEDSANTAVISETMASKVCPVCKTFSSSSNTTLNAHIDQCLSGESTAKWTTSSKVIKHRIKPRKTRLMVDIYETALHCTLEDLDRRNGTNWASNLGLPSQDLEASTEEEKKTYAPVNTEDINQEGAVYIDSSGTKLRILSKLGHLPSNSNANHDSGQCKFVKRDKGSKILSSKKKKDIVQKHKLRRHSLDGQGSCSPVLDHLLECPPHGPNSCSPRLEVNNGQQKLFPSESYKDKDPTQPLIASDRLKSDDFGMIKQWVGSKRSGLKKKMNLEHENQHPDKSMKNLRVKSVSSLGDMLAKGNTAPISPISSDENPLSTTKSHKRKENLSCNSQDVYVGRPCQKKRPAVALAKSQSISEKKNKLMFSKLNVKLSQKYNPSFHEPHMDPPNGTEIHLSSRSNPKMGIRSSPNIKDDSSFTGSSMSQHHTFSSEGKKFASLGKTSLGHAISSGSKKFSSLRTKLLSVRHASVAESKKKLGRKLLHIKNRRMRCTSQSGEEAVLSRSALHRENNLVETLAENATRLDKDCGKPLINRTRVLKIRKKIGGVRNTDKEDVTSKCLETSPESDRHSVGKNIDSFTGVNVPVDTSNILEEEAEIQDEFVREPTYGITDAEAFVSFSKSFDSAFPGLTGSSNVESGSHYYNGHCPSELVLHDDQEMFCADKVGQNLVTANCHVVAEMDADEAQGNYFVDVDPIPIPGPPGSFLPSPGRMGSEELQGHSSLTTCRIQSSEEGHEVVDMDSSDSPISAVSAVSNSVAGRSNSTSINNLSVQSKFQRDIQCDISEDRSGPVIEGSSSFEQVASGERELNLLQSRPNLSLPEVTREVQNIQPCCCSRKDGSFHGGSLNYQDSPILRRRTLTSPVVALEKQMSNDQKNEIHCLNLRSESVSRKEPTPEPEKDVTNTPMGYAPVLVSHNSETMFSPAGDCESPSPSTPNPVLRLMGKNLMVMNKDDNPSPQSRPTQSSMVMDHPGLRSCAENGLSTSNNQNELNSFHHVLSRGPSTFDSMQPHIPSQHIDFNSSDGFKVPANYGPPQLSARPSANMFSSMSFGRSVSSTPRCHEYAGGFNLIPDQLGSKIRLDCRPTYDTEKVCTPVHHLKTADSSGSKHKEIIIIDDSSESEAGLAVNAMHCDVNMEAGGSVGSATPMALHSDSRCVNPFYSYQTQVYPRFTGSPIVSIGNTLVPPSKGMNASLAKWNCIPEGSSVLHSNSSTASLPSAVHLRSSAYFSPGFS